MTKRKPDSNRNLVGRAFLAYYMAGQRGGCTVTDLADAADVSRATAHRTLDELAEFPAGKFGRLERLCGRTSRSALRFIHPEEVE